MQGHELRNRRSQLYDAKATIESLVTKETDATRLVSNLHNQITLLQEENRILDVKLAGTGKYVDQQLEWSHIRAERRRIASTK